MKTWGEKEEEKRIGRKRRGGGKERREKVKVGRKRMRRKGVQVEKERGGVGLKRELTLPPQHHRINHPSPLPGDDHDHDPNPDDPDPDHHHHEWETVASAGTHESHQIMLTDEPTALQCRHHRHRQCHLHQQCNFIPIPCSIGKRRTC